MQPPFSQQFWSLGGLHPNFLVNELLGTKRIFWQLEEEKCVSIHKLCGIHSIFPFDPDLPKLWLKLE